MSTHKDLYAILEVSRDADKNSIQEAYRRLGESLETDSMALYSMLDPSEIDGMRDDLELAYFTLSNPKHRGAYDADGVLPPPSLVENHKSQEAYPSLLVERPNRTSDHTGNTSSHRADDIQSQLNDKTIPPQIKKNTQRTKTYGTSHPVVSKEAPQKRFVSPMLAELGEDTEFSGNLLRKVRESANASINDIAELTKVSKRYIKAIEANDFDVLPATVYVRGFVAEYAKALGLDPAMVSKSFMTLYRRYKDSGR